MTTLRTPLTLGNGNIELDVLAADGWTLFSVPAKKTTRVMLAELVRRANAHDALVAVATVAANACELSPGGIEDLQLMARTVRAALKLAKEPT